MSVQGPGCLLAYATLADGTACTQWIAHMKASGKCFGKPASYYWVHRTPQE